MIAIFTRHQVSGKERNIMQDRFKFRAWDKRHKEYAYDVQNEFQKYGHMICETLDFGQVLNDDELELEQCTGLTDKNNKLIYEGDILKSAYTEKTYIVGREKHYVCWSYRYKNVGTTLSEGDIVNYGLEVIGNIHENSELLEDNK